MSPKHTRTAIHTWHGMRDTQPRRLVLKFLGQARKALSAQELHERIRTAGDVINLVTVYRILERFQSEDIVHRHPSGDYSLCTIPEHLGHHGFLTCTDCGKTTEFHEPDLCKIENAIARKAGYKPGTHLTEIMGTCKSCS